MILRVVLAVSIALALAYIGGASAGAIARLIDTSIDGPRCEKEDLMGVPLAFSIAQRGDRVLSWRLFCDYRITV